MTQPAGLPDQTNQTETGGREIAHDVALVDREWDKPWKSRFLNALARGTSVSKSCRYARIARCTVYAERDTDPDFKTAWEEARWVGVDGADDILHEWGTIGHLQRKTVRTVERDTAGNIVRETTVDSETPAVRSVTALVTWLKAHYPEKYGDRVDHRLPAGPVEVRIYRPLTPERLRELAPLMIEQNLREHPDVEVEGSSQPALPAGESE